MPQPEDKPMTTVSEAVATRRSVRRFLPEPVSREVLARILDKARRAPSGGNLQPWRGVVLTGEPLDAVKSAVQARAALGPAAMEPEFRIFPANLPSPWKDRKDAMGETLYGALGIPREDEAGRRRQLLQNFHAFGAPVLMIVLIDRRFGPSQWADIGIWLQTVMLLVREEGLDCCPQQSWSAHGPTIRATLGLGDDVLVYCGLAIGRRDPDAPVNAFAMPRAPLEETIEFRGF